MPTKNKLQSIFDLTRRPDDDLFFSRDDPHDIRLADILHTTPDDYTSSDIVIFGCPQDEGVRRNRGRTGATEAPREIRRALYKLAVPRNIAPGALFDLGDLIMTTNLEDTHRNHRDVVRRLLRDDKVVIVLGGGNDISYPDCSALHDVYPDILAFNIDSHFDVREADHPHSGTPYRQLLEQNILNPKHFYEIGSKPGSNPPAYEEYLKDKGVHIYSLDSFRGYGISKLFTEVLGEFKGKAVFWGFDIDAVRETDAPGVSAPNPIGLSAEEICSIAAIAGDEPHSRIMEITEVNPQFDPDNRTSRLAATMILYFLNALYRNRR